MTKLGPKRWLNLLSKNISLFYIFFVNLQKGYEFYKDVTSITKGLVLLIDTSWITTATVVLHKNIQEIFLLF